MANSGNPILDEIDGLSPAAKQALGMALPKPPAYTATDAPPAVGGPAAAIRTQPAPAPPASAPRPIARPMPAPPALAPVATQAQPQALPAAGPLMPKPPALAIPANGDPPLAAGIAPLAVAPSYAAAGPLAAETDRDRAALARITAPALGPANLLAHTKADTGESGIGQIHSKWGRIPLEIADAFGSAFFPKVMLNVPGTELHHNVLVREAEHNVAADQAEQAAEEKNLQTEALTGAENANAGEAQARARLAGAQAGNLEHPPAAILPTSEGEFSFNPRTGAVTPISGPNGEPLQPYVKPGNRQHVVLKGENGQPMLGFVDPVSGLTTDAEGHLIEHPVPFEKPAAAGHITVMGKDGKPYVMGMDARGNFTRNLGEAPPNYAE
ncbi:MAG: hypothetical protein ACRD19_06055, partial [Terriglobia bacterium]